MAGMLFGFPFNEELFAYRCGIEPDPINEAIIQSGVMQENADIEKMIEGGSDRYTIPFYNTLAGDPQNYDGDTDLVPVETSGAYQSGIVFGRMQGWTARDFTKDFNRLDPMGSIVAQVSHFWAKYWQRMLIGIASGLFDVKAPSGDEDKNGYYAAWQKHTMDVTSASTTVAEGNKMGEATYADATTFACGDNAADAFKLAFMHSTVANNLAKKDLLEYRKYSDPLGLQRQIRLADHNGMTVVVSDICPHTEATADSAATYKSYGFGLGAFQSAFAPVEVPIEANREAKKNGGQDELIMRYRRTIHPNGWTYEKKDGDGGSPTNEMLFSPTRYKPVFDPKAIPMVCIVTNG